MKEEQLLLFLPVSYGTREFVGFLNFWRFWKQTLRLWKPTNRWNIHPEQPCWDLIRSCHYLRERNNHQKAGSRVICDRVEGTTNTLKVGPSHRVLHFEYWAKEHPFTWMGAPQITGDILIPFSWRRIPPARIHTALALKGLVSHSTYDEFRRVMDSDFVSFSDSPVASRVGIHP